MSGPDGRCAWLILDNDADLLNSYDMYKDVEEKLAIKRGQRYTGPFICGLPVGMKLPNGVTIGE